MRICFRNALNKISRPHRCQKRIHRVTDISAHIKLKTRIIRTYVETDGRQFSTRTNIESDTGDSLQINHCDLRLSSSRNDLFLKLRWNPWTKMDNIKRRLSVYVLGWYNGNRKQNVENDVNIIINVSIRTLGDGRIQVTAYFTWKNNYSVYNNMYIVLYRNDDILNDRIAKNIFCIPNDVDYNILM